MSSNIKFWLRRKLITDAWVDNLHNRDFCILANDCTGGMLYHDLGMKFNTPTVNLFFQADDYIKFCSDLKAYLKEELVEIKTDKSYPVGLLGDIAIYFTHYGSFDEAKKKWTSRVERINYDNIFLLDNDRNSCSEQTIQLFEKLPYPRIMFTHHKMDYPHTFYIPGFETEESVGVILHYRSKLSISRYYDSFDFINWLNNK